MVELKKIATEQRNPNTMNIDSLSTHEMIRLINREDHRVAEAVSQVTEEIAKAVDVIADRLSKGGRLIYCGAGTSGRLGILDAVECPPTYSTEPEMVQGLIAGGYPAIFKAVEGAEDNKELGVEDMKGIRFTAGDVLVGVAASGRTPYVLGCMEYAKELGVKPSMTKTEKKNQEKQIRSDYRDTQNALIEDLTSRLSDALLGVKLPYPIIDGDAENQDSAVLVNANTGIAVGTLVILFAVGFILFCKADKLSKQVLANQ